MGKGTEVSEWKLEPFPHAVLDGVWSADTLHMAAAEFPGADDPRWITYPQPEEYGKRAGDERMWGPAVSHAMEILRSDWTREGLEKLTGIPDLSADALGGGMHMTCEGGRLAMHTDFNVHPTTRLRRRLNMLVFLNEEWEQEWGGVLYLGADREVAVTPLFNRTVVFECSEQSWHGHPEPVTAGHCRRSLACYWYTPVDVPLTEHSTLWLGS